MGRVVSWDGNLVYNREYGFRDFGWGEYVPGFAFNQGYYRAWTRGFGIFKREPYGQVEYFVNEKGEVEVELRQTIRGTRYIVTHAHSVLYNGYDSNCCSN